MAPFLFHQLLFKLSALKKVHGSTHSQDTLVDFLGAAVAAKPFTVS